MSYVKIIAISSIIWTGASAVTSQKNNFTLLIEAIEAENTQKALQLIPTMSSKELGQQDPQWNSTPLFWALGRQMPQVALALIPKMNRIDLNKTNTKGGSTPLTLSIAQQWPYKEYISTNNQLSEVALALIKKLSVQELVYKDKNGNSALSVAKQIQTKNKNIPNNLQKVIDAIEKKLATTSQTKTTTKKKK